MEGEEGSLGTAWLRRESGWKDVLEGSPRHLQWVIST